LRRTTSDGDGLVDFFVTTSKTNLACCIAQGPLVSSTDISSAADCGLRVGRLSAGELSRSMPIATVSRLVVTNGHVDDYRAEGGAYQMRPQFFRITGGGTLRELMAPAAGPYFRDKYLGRGLARLDWNRDGKMDFAFPTSMPGHRSSPTGTQNGRALHQCPSCHARATARDAIAVWLMTPPASVAGASN